MTVYVHDSFFMTRRGVVLLAIIGLHIFIAWALATGLARRALEVIAPPIQTDIVEEVKTQKEPPPPPPPEFQKPPVEVPPPDVTIDMPVEAPATSAITAVAATPHAPAPPVHVGSHKAPTVAKNFPASEEYYPAASKRLNEEGAPTVHVCVGANSKLTAVPTISQSSGSPRLDEGALNLAKAGRYIAGMDDGKPIDACFDFRIKFQMTK
ncbi:MAG TPA: energy transducer TonB [Steroidobacteraceae bacterium]|nr:energy transducer TonB [Steroidobacteraceae bacterium]